MDTKKLRQKILDLAIRGKLVPQDPKDEPASALIEKIRAEKEQLIKEKKIKRDKNESYIFRSDKSYYEKFADGTVKCIDEEIPFEIPESWEWARLGSIARTILYGVSESAQTEGNYKLLRITDIQNNTVNWENVPFTTLPEDKAMEYLLRKDDILFARTGATVGKSYLVNEVSNDAIYASYLIRVRLFELFESQYIKFYFESGFYWSQITDKSVGVGQPNVNGTSLKSLLIPVPPYEEQIQVGEQALMLTNIIDNIDNNKTLLAISIKNVKSKILDLAIRGKFVSQDPNDEPASALLERIKAEHPESKAKAENISDNSHYPFSIPKSWKWIQIREIGTIITGNTPSKENKKLYGLDFPFYKPADLEQGISVHAATDNLSLLGYEASRKLPVNSILVTCIGATIGKTGLIKQEGTCNQQINAIIPYFPIESTLVYYYFISSFFQTQIKDNASATTLPIINKSKFEQLQIAIPPLNEQKRIIKKIEKIFASLDEIANSIRA